MRTWTSLEARIPPTTQHKAALAFLAVPLLSTFCLQWNPYIFFTRACIGLSLPHSTFAKKFKPPLFIPLFKKNDFSLTVDIQYCLSLNCAPEVLNLSNTLRKMWTLSCCVPGFPFLSVSFLTGCSASICESFLQVLRGEGYIQGFVQADTQVVNQDSGFWLFKQL